VNYAQGLDEAGEYAAKAIDLMKADGVPPTPQNFEVWFNYAAGADQDLVRTIDVVRTNKRDFSKDTCDEIFERFFGTDSYSDAVSEISDKVSAEISTVLESLERAGKDTSDYGEALTGISGQLGTKDPRAAKALIEQLVVATRHMEARTKELETKLNKSTQEVNELRGDLENIRTESLTDQLTGVSNRKCFDERLRTAAMEAMEEGTPMCLIMADIDHFKSFNDTWGHQTGDQVLRLVAHCLKDNVKGRDTAARYGGEEFAVILPSTQLAAARTVAEQIRTAVESKRVVKRSSGETLGTITLSLGVAEFEAGEPLPELINRADACLYAAKRAGRNLVQTQEEVEVDMVLDNARAARSEKAARAAG